MKKTIIGLTGPIAAGKDIVAGMFSRHGALVIDADELGHEIMAPQSKAWHEIVKTFGVKVLIRGGKVNRKKLGRIVFWDPSALRKLNRILHPAMRALIKESIRQTKKKLIVINAAVLAEMGLLPIVDRVIVVLAGERARIKRLMKCGLSRRDAIARVRSQAGASSYRRIADIVIVNNGSVKVLREKVEEIIHKLRS